MTEPRLLSVNQACAVAGVTRATIHRWIRAGHLEWCRTVGGSIRIARDSLFQKDPQGPPVPDPRR